MLCGNPREDADAKSCSAGSQRVASAPPSQWRSCWQSLLAVGPGRRQGHQGVPDRRQDRAARGLRQADRERLHDGPGVPHQGHHEGRRRQARDHRQGRPAQARSRQVAAGGMLRRRQGRPRRRHHRLAGGARHAAGRRGAQEGADRRAGGGRLDHRRQVEPLHLPHRPQLLPGRAGRRRGLPRQRGGVGRHAGARHRLRPRRRRGLQGGAGGAAAQRQDRRRGICRRQHRRLRAVRRAPVQCAEGQAGQEGDRLHLGRPASARQVRRHEARALRHRAGARRQHPARR